MPGLREITPLLVLSLATLLTAITANSQQATKLRPPSPISDKRDEQRMTIGPNVQVSKAFADMPHQEIHLAANPRNPLNLVGGSMVFDQKKNLMTVIAYTSFDGGKTWTPTLTFDDHFYYSDPAAAFAPDGTAFFLQIKNTHDREPKYFTQIYRSKDGGKTWSTPAVMPMLDRHYIAFNARPGDPRNGAFINGFAGGLRVSRSRDGGATFEEARQAATTPAGSLAVGAAPIQILSDGKIVVPFFEMNRDELIQAATTEGVLPKTNASMKVVISDNGADNFSEPVTVSEIGVGHSLTSSSNHFSSAADQSDGLFKDRIYVVWSDSFLSSGSPVSGKKVKGANILLSASSDGGKSWSKPVQINDDSSSDPDYAPVHFRPVVAVNRDGVVGVMWYDRRDSANGLDFTSRFSASLDGGETFLPSVKVSDAPFAYTKFTQIVATARPYGGGQRPLNRSFWGGLLRFDLAISPPNVDGGHTAGLAADASGTFHPFWVDNRTGVSQIWTAPVIVNGKPAVNGAAELSTLEDVSGRILLKLANPTFDLTAGRLIVDAIIENVSDDTIMGPAKLRVMVMYASSGGVARIVDEEGQHGGIGIVWDFSDVLIDNRLKPNQSSKPKTLQFQLSGVPTLSGERIKAMGPKALELIHLEAKMLANVEGRSKAQNR